MREIYKGISTRWLTTKQNERSLEAVYNKSLDIVYCLSFKSNKIRSLREYTGIEEGVAVSSDNDVHPSEAAGHVTVMTEALVAHGDDLVDPVSHQFIGLGLYSRQLIGELHISCEDGYRLVINFLVFERAKSIPRFMCNSTDKICYKYQ